MDYGNDTLKVKTVVNSNIKITFKNKYEKLIIPMLDDCQIYIAGTGNDINLVRAHIEIVDRNTLLNNHKHIKESCPCNIF